ncbi:hypothetical protein ACWG8W_06380 [Citricoccus zhacaiensis]
MSMTANQNRLEALSQSKRFDDRKIAALDSETHADTLARLARDESLIIVGYAAGHPNTRPEDLLAAFIAVNEAIANTDGIGHPTTSVEEVVDSARANPITAVQDILTRNPNTPSEALMELARNPRTPLWLLRGVASHGNCPADLLVRLAEGKLQRAYGNFELDNLRLDALRNPAFPQDEAADYTDAALVGSHVIAAAADARTRASDG